MQDNQQTVMRLALPTSLFLATAALLGTTLDRLSLEQMTQQSTGIVRGRVSACAGEMRQNLIYTRCEIAVTETWKGRPAASTSVYVPGGRAGGYMQTIAGSPALAAGQEYVIFLWAGRSGINQVIGLHQGVFQLAPDGKGGVVAQRSATSERMLDSSGREVADRDVRYSASELRQRVQEILGGTQ